MGIFPIIMNVMQFWLIDSIVKDQESHSGLSLPISAQGTPHDQDREPLFRASESDDEDDTSSRPKHDIENPPHSAKSLNVEPTVPASKLTPNPTPSSVTRSVTPVEVEQDDVAMRRYRSDSLTEQQSSNVAKTSPITLDHPQQPPPAEAGDEWGWGDAEGDGDWEDEGGATHRTLAGAQS